MPRLRRILARLLAGLLVAVLVLGLIEGALRLLLGPPPPSVRVYQALEEHQHYFEIEGNRARPLYKKVPPFIELQHEGPRAAVLGGSSVSGGTPRTGPRGEFPARLEDALGIPVYNLGWPGLDSFDLVQIVEETAPVGLEALVVYTGHNDFGNTHFESRYGSLRSALLARTQALLGRLQIYAQLSRTLRAPTGSLRQRNRRMAPEVQPALMNPARQQAALASLEANLRRLCWLAGRQGRRVVLVTPVSLLVQEVPTEPCIEPGCPADMLREAWALKDSDPTRARRLLEQARDADPAGIRAPTIAQERIREIAAGDDNIILVDAQRDLPRDPDFDVPDRALFIDPVHLTLHGHAEMARLITPALAEALGLRAR